MDAHQGFDFGLENRTCGFAEARLVLLFSTDARAVADAGKYAEFFELLGGVAPFDIGVASEFCLGVDGAADRARQALNAGKTPIVVSEQPVSFFPPDATTHLLERNRAHPSVDDVLGPVHFLLDGNLLLSGYEATSDRAGRLPWYELMDLTQSVFAGPGVISVNLFGVGAAAPGSPLAQFYAQMVIKMVGFVRTELHR